MQAQTDIAIALGLCVAIACVFGFPSLAVMSWARERRREREALYRHDVLSKLVEQQGATGEVLRALGAEAAAAEAQRRNALRVAGLTLAAGGAALALALATLPVGTAWLLGGVPGAAGGAILLHLRLRSAMP